MVKQSISKSWAKAKSTGERARSSSGTRGGGGVGRSGYSSAVSRVLQEDGGGGGGGDDEILTGVAGGSSRPPLSNAGSGSGKSDQPRGEPQPQRPQQARNGSVGRLKNRSPSPIRHYLGRLSITKSSTTDDRRLSMSQPTSQQQQQSRAQQQQKPPLSPEKHSHSSVELDDNDNDDHNRDSALDLMVNCMVHRTTMSFDVDSPEAAAADETNNNINGILLESTPISPSSRKKQQQHHQQTMLKTSIKESDLEDTDEEGYYINTTSFNIFESQEFLTAMGASVSEASLATNYIRTGDSLCAGNKADKFDQAVQVYYAGLGAILARIREWSLEYSKGELISSSSMSTEHPIDRSRSAAPDDGASHITYHDLLQVAHSPETNLLLLAMSSILLRAGNAHFRLRQYELACRDYVSAQCYRLLRHEAKDIISEERTRHSESHIEDAKLNGRISNNMASAQSKRGMYDEARSEYTKALQIKQGTLETLHNTSNGGGGKNDMDKNLISDIASTFHNIGLLRMKCGEPKKAEKAYKQSLSLRVKKFGVNDIGISSTLNALGGLYYHQKQHDDAFRSYKESLRIWKSHSGKSDLKTAEYYYNIGLVFYSKGPFIKAMSAVAECLRIRREQLTGNERLPVASALYLLGLISTSLGNYDEALTLLQESLAIRQELLTQRDHLLLSNVHVALGLVQQKRDDFDSAMDCFSIALEGRTLRLGRDHEHVSEVLQAIGMAYTEVNEYHKASETFEEALRIRKNSMSSGLGVAETLNSLGLVRFKTGDTEKAIEMSEEALGVLKTAVEFDHLLVAKVLKNAGDYYQYVEAYDDALEAYSESFRIMTEFYGKEHVFMSEILNELGVTRFKKGDYMTSKQLFTEVSRPFLCVHRYRLLYISHSNCYLFLFIVGIAADASQLK
jgi:tetratricopeptide (TPR) repeat protein